MLCSKCSKLLLKHSDTKKCMKCGLSTNLILAVLCDGCSESSQSCSICCKKIVNNDKIHNGTKTSGCQSCKKG